MMLLLVFLILSNWNQGLAKTTLLSSTSSGCTFEVPPGKELVGVLVGIPPTSSVSCNRGEVDQIAWIRRHRIARITVRPYEQTKKKVTVSWQSGKAGYGQPEDTPFEMILRNHVINYEKSQSWGAQI